MTDIDLRALASARDGPSPARLPVDPIGRVSY